MRLGRVGRRMTAIFLTAAMSVTVFSANGVSVMAATGQLKGFFRDIKDWRGAVVGTAYEQATDELEVIVEDASEDITVLVTMVNPDKAPYFTFEELSVEAYEIMDNSGNIVLKGEAKAMAKITDGKATIIVPAKELDAGTYKLIIHSFVGGSKAEQPLPMSGNWECEFSR